MIIPAVFVLCALVAGTVMTLVLVDIVCRRRTRRLIDGHMPGLRPGDCVLTNFGAAATVLSIEGRLVVLRYGAGEQERTIFAERGTIIRTTADGEAGIPASPRQEHR